MKKYISILVLVLLFFPFVAQAGLFDILGNILLDIVCILTGIACPDPCMQLLSDIGTASYRLCGLLDNIAEALYLIGWGLALVVLLWGGIVYMVSGGEEEKTKKAKNIIKSGLIGAAIVLCAGFILSLLVEFLSPLFYY